MSAKTVNLCSTKRCNYCLQTKDLRKLGQNYRVKGKLVNYSQMLADCFPKHWSGSPNNHDGYLCMSCIPKLRDATNLRKMILKSHGVHGSNHGVRDLKKKIPEKGQTYDDTPMVTDDVCESNNNLSKQDQNQVKNCDENLDNTLMERDRHSLYGFSMDETYIIKLEDEENYTDSELIVIENRYECNQESNQEIKDISTPIRKVEIECAPLEFMERPSAEFNENSYKFNQELNVNKKQYNLNLAQSSTDPQENIEIKEEEYLEDEYMDLEFNENIQDQSHHKGVAVDYNDSQRKLNNGTTNKEDIMILKVEDPNQTNTVIKSGMSVMPQNIPEIIPNSEEDILILKIEEQEPINDTITEPIDYNCEPVDSNSVAIDSNCKPIDSNCEPIDLNCELVNCEVDTTFNNVISQLSQSEIIENAQSNEDIIILQVGGHASHSKQIEMLENDISEQNIDDTSTNNMGTDDGDHELKSKKDNVLKNKRTIKYRKPDSRITYTDEQLKDAVIAIKEGRLSVTQAVLRLKMNFRTFHKRTTQLFGVTFPRKEKKWDYRGYFREIVTILNTTNCSPFKSRGNNIYCAYCCPKSKKQDGISYTPDQLREHVKAQHPAPTYEDVKGFMYPFNRHELIKMDILDLECIKCPLKIDSWSDMLTHLKHVHGKEIKDGAKKIIPYILHDVNKCILCEETFSNHVKLEVHMNVHYPNYICNECGVHFAAKWSLYGHKAIYHSHYKVYCDKCGMEFYNKVSLRTHIYKQHVKVNRKVFKCSGCREKFDTAIHLSEHEESYQHGEQKPCIYCEKIFYSKLAHNEHVETHTHEEHICTICNTKYKDMVGLKGHLRRVHLDDIYYECEVCKYRFGNKSYLSKHQKRKHFDVWISKRQVLALAGSSKASKYSKIRKEDDYIPKFRDQEDSSEKRTAGDLMILK